MSMTHLTKNGHLFHLIYSLWLLANIEFELTTVLSLITVSGDIESNPGPPPSPIRTEPQVLKSLALCHLNIQSMRRNTEKLKHVEIQLSGKYDIITVSETWLSPNILNDAYTINGYYPLFRRDRMGRTPGGGVAAWVSFNLVAKRRIDLELPDVEAMWLEIRSENHVFLICTMYRPHTEGMFFWDNTPEMLDNARLTGISNIIFAGDLNADKLSRSNDVKRHGEMFEFFVETNHLTSHINEPTRITSQTQSHLDRIFSITPQGVVILVMVIYGIL